MEYPEVFFYKDRLTDERLEEIKAGDVVSIYAGKNAKQATIIEIGAQDAIEWKTGKPIKIKANQIMIQFTSGEKMYFRAWHLETDKPTIPGPKFVSRRS